MDVAQPQLLPQLQIPLRGFAAHDIDAHILRQISCRLQKNIEALTPDELPNSKDHPVLRYLQLLPKGLLFLPGGQVWQDVRGVE